MPHVSLQQAGEKLVEDLFDEFDKERCLNFELPSIKAELGSEFDENGFVEEATHAFKQYLLTSFGYLHTLPDDEYNSL